MLTRWFAVLLVALALIAAPVQAGAPDYSLSISAVSAANTIVTLTIPAGTGNVFHQLLSVTVDTGCTAAIVGTAVLTVTTTNMPGSLAWSFGDACAIGSTNHQVGFYPGPVGPISSVAATATTIVCPATGATGICRITATYRFVQP